MSEMITAILQATLLTRDMVFVHDMTWALACIHSSSIEKTRSRS